MSESSMPPGNSVVPRVPVPVSTYRLQLHAEFTFRDAQAIVPYLHRLGVGAVYLSPFFRACPGSTHGYDICDYNQLNPEIGSEADYDAFSAELSHHGMGQILDFVPNHMAVESVQNRWWRDMLEHGPASPSARFFDVDWNPIKPELHGKVLLPFLGDHYGRVLERGELQLGFEDGAFVVRYFQNTRPIDPRQYPRVLRLNLQVDPADEDSQMQEFLSILTALENIPPATVRGRELIAVRLRESRLAKERLGRLVHASQRIAQHIEQALKTINGTSGDPHSFDLLHELLESQSYRLAYWKTAVHEINFRRFFDINQLAGLRMEDPKVFEATHGLVLRLIREGKITGLRLDHIDGLFDPLEYLQRLQGAILRGQIGEAAGQAPAETRALYVVVEKILSGSELLSDQWPVHGTSGYAFLNDLNRVFVDPRNGRAMRRVWEQFTELTDPMPEVIYECKRMITGTSLASELNVLGHELNRISEADRCARDFTLYSLRQTLREIASCFPVYRTYVNATGATQADREAVDLAIRRARRRNPAMEDSVFDFVRDALLPDPEKFTGEAYRDRLHFAMKFQQYTSPLQAKGIEDTAFYRYNVLISLNEVGGDPQQFGWSIKQFHQTNLDRFQRYPHTMLATATHDTKRGEDARARLNLLSEIPEVWQTNVTTWAEINAENHFTVDGEMAPDRNDEFLFYQALLGAWPAEPAGTMHEAAPEDVVNRLRNYMSKAVKEAKVHSSWVSPNAAYEEGVSGFVEKTLSGPTARRFLATFLPFQQRLARLGMVVSLAQVVLKIASPGVPDFYQGTGLWDLSLVDPDNRRPVDYSQRVHELEAMEPWLTEQTPRSIEDQAEFLNELLGTWWDGRVKLYTTACGLRLRRRLRDVFLDGEYIPLEIEGEGSDHVIGLARRHGDQCVLAVVPRLIQELSGDSQTLPISPESWRSTRIVLPEGLARPYRNQFSGERLTPNVINDRAGLLVADCLRFFPVALFQSVE